MVESPPHERGESSGLPPIRRCEPVTPAALGLLALLAVVVMLAISRRTAWSIDLFFARVTLTAALRRPMLLSQARILEPWGIEWHSRRLDDFSPGFAAREARWLDRQIAILARYDVTALPAGRRLSAETLAWFMSDLRDGVPFMYHDYPVNQLTGAQVELPDFMINVHRIDDVAGADDYVTRVARIKEALEQVIEGLDLRERRGIVPPRFVLRQAAADAQRLADAETTSNPLRVHFERRARALPDIDADRLASLLERLDERITTLLRPACRRLADTCRRLETIATDDDGVWRLPDGEACYAWLLRHHTTLDITPARAHEMGLSEVARLEEEMRNVLAELGETGSPPAVVMARWNRLPASLYEDTPEGRETILDDFRRIVKEAEAFSRSLFARRPEASIAVERLPALREEHAPVAWYQPAPMDRSRPATLFVNLSDLSRIPRHTIRTLACHEAIPGHHTQIGIAQELAGLPLFRRVLPFTAFAEGWALYAEQLAAENGFMDDPHDRLGYLTGQIWRSARLVVDTGIHALRWTRSAAVDYMERVTGMPRADVAAEVDRYVVMPGQACAYKTGQMAILELRRRASERLGPRFDIREFHEVVLGNGALPLGLLERQVRDWIKARAGT